MITSVAGLFRLNNTLFGWGIHLILSAIIGGIYGLWFSVFDGPAKYSDGLASGMIYYSFLGWLIGPATIAGVLTGRGPLWSIPDFSELFPDLIAYLLFGTVLGAVYPIVYRAYIERQALQLPPQLWTAVIRGALAGALVGLIFINRLPQIGLLPLPGMSAAATPPIIFWLLSVVVGIVLSVVVVDAGERAGVGLIRHR